MSIIFADNFRTYPSGSEMISEFGRNGPYNIFQKGANINASYYSIEELETWRGDGSTIRKLMNAYTNDRYAPQIKFSSSPLQSVCGQFICGSSSGTQLLTESCNFIIFNEIPDIYDSISGNNLSSFYGISIKAVSSSVGENNRVGVYYTIMTGSTGAVNTALIGYLRPWDRDKHYHVEFKVDHTNPIARIIVYVNGILEIDATYDRDRIDSGYQTKSFDRFILGGGASSSSLYRDPYYSNVIIYSDEGNTPFPMGPIDVKTISTTIGAGYDEISSSPNADDSTYKNIPPGGSLSGTFSDLTSSPNPILSVDANVKNFSSNGIEPSLMTTQIKNSSGGVISSIITTSSPGSPPVRGKKNIAGSFTEADVNGMTFTINSGA